MSFNFSATDSQSDPSNISNTNPPLFLGSNTSQGFSFNAPNASTTSNLSFSSTPANATPFGSNPGVFSNANNLSQPGSNAFFTPTQNTSTFGSTSAFVGTSNNSNNNLFGVSPSPANTGLFNATPSSQSSSLFGSSSNTGGLGLSGNNSQGLFPSSNTSTGLFGSTSTSNTNSIIASNNTGFGSAPATSGSNNTNATNSIFGSASNTTPAPSGCFGAVNNSQKSNNSLFSSTSQANAPIYKNTPQTTTSSAPTFNPMNQNAPNPQCGIFGNPSPFGNPNLFAHQNNFFNGPSGSIPKFEEIPRNPVRHPYNISLTEKGSETDLILIVNYTDTYKLCSKSVFKQCEIFKDLKEGGNTQLELEIPFPDSFFEALFWIVFRCDEKLANYIQSFRTLLEVHASFNILKVNKFINTFELLINTCSSKGLTNNIPSFPAVLNKKYIDLAFIEKIVDNSHGLFGFTNHLVRSAILLEWLGERDCETEEDVKELKMTQEFNIIGKALDRLNCMPLNVQDYALLCARYPVASQIITLQQMLKAFSLLRT